MFFVFWYCFLCDRGITHMQLFVINFAEHNLEYWFVSIIVRYYR